jgi:hypothetical protein
MVNRVRNTFALGCVVWLGSTGCAPEVLPLGDEPLGGSGGSHTGGSATEVDPPVVGGATQVEPPNEGGATQECYAPQHRPELAIQPNAVGCPCDQEPEECVRVQYDGRPWDVSLHCIGGKWESVDDGVCSIAPQECFAPQHRPELAVQPNAVGCPCDQEPEECVRVQYNGRHSDVSLYCMDGKWESVDDGVCSAGAACLIEGITYPTGARRVPNPYSRCNVCRCMNGELVDCTGAFCADTSCPEDTFAARSCVDCGTGPGGCGTYEIGCFAGPECEDGMCGLVCI